MFSNKNLNRLRTDRRSSTTATSIACFCICLSFTQSAQAQISWNITFEDVTNGSGFGFHDNVLGATRRDTFNQAASYISSRIVGNATLDFTVSASLNNGTGSLASAGTLFSTSPNGFTSGILQTHAITGTDPFSGTHDGHAVFDFGYNWNSGLSAPTSSQYDLFSIALHEITHALGFVTLADSSGTSNISHANPGVYSVLDSFLSIAGSTALFSDTNGATFTGSASDLTSDNLYFTGPNAVAANGGNPVRMHAPSTFKVGSSLSHIDSSLSSVMNPLIAPGATRRTYTDLDIAVLQDLGWSITPVPEPSIASLLTIALLPILRRQRRRHGQRANP